MKKILITGAGGFLGRNLTAHLSQRDDLNLLLFDLDNSQTQLREWVSQELLLYDEAMRGRRNPNS